MDGTYGIFKEWKVSMTLRRQPCEFFKMRLEKKVEEITTTFRTDTIFFKRAAK